MTIVDLVCEGEDMRREETRGFGDRGLKVHIRVRNRGWRLRLDLEDLFETVLLGQGLVVRGQGLLTLKICLRLCSEGVGRHSMLKWRMKRGVTGLRPPPGGAQAAAIVMSCREKENEREEGRNGGEGGRKEDLAQKKDFLPTHFHMYLNPHIFRCI